MVLCSTDSDILALCRLAARRGLPTKIYSNCATTFKAAKGACCKLYGHLAPKWNFSVPVLPDGAVGGTNGQVHEIGPKEILWV